MLPTIMDKYAMADQSKTDNDLTRSPQMNDVIKEANGVLDGTGNVQSLQNSIIDLELQIKQLDMAYQYESKFQEQSDLFNRESVIIRENFVKLKTGINLIHKYFEDADKKTLEEGITICIESYDELFGSFDRLKKEDEKRTVWSESPYLNEICRVADCVKRGTLPRERMKDRIETFLQIQHRFMMDFDNMNPTIDERPIVDEMKDEVKVKLNEVQQGLQLALSYFQNNNFENVDAGLEQARVAVDFLLDFEKRLKTAREAPKIKFCFKCGTENKRHNKFCVKCNFKFPPLQMEEESTMDIRVDEGGIKQTEHVLTENVVKLNNAVEKAKDGEISMEEYMETIFWFEDLLRKGREEQAKIVVPDDMDQETMEAFEQFRETFELGMGDMEDGIKRLQVFAETNDHNLLDTGMEMILRGGDRLYQVQMTANQLKLAMEQGAGQG